MVLSFQMYSDYGFHTSSVKLQRNTSGRFVRVVSGKHSEKCVYVCMM